MTPAQSVVWALAIRLNKDEFEGWFAIESIMAYVQIESNFRPHAYRRELSGVASYGLLQVLDITAKEFEIADPTLMWQPEIGLRTGMKVARSSSFMHRRWRSGQPPTMKGLATCSKAGSIRPMSYLGKPREIIGKSILNDTR